MNNDIRKNTERNYDQELQEFYNKHHKKRIKLEKESYPIWITLFAKNLISNTQAQMVLRYHQKNYKIEICEDESHGGKFHIMLEIDSLPSDYEAIVVLKSKFTPDLPETVFVEVDSADALIKSGDKRVKIGTILAGIPQDLDNNFEIKLSITTEELTLDEKSTEIQMLENLQYNIAKRIQELKR